MVSKRAWWSRPCCGAKSFVRSIGLNSALWREIGGVLGERSISQPSMRLGRNVIRHLSSSKPLPPYAVSVDRSKLLRGRKDSNVEKGSDTSMLAHLSQRIKLRNPLTIAEYMRECLTNPVHGYYMKKEVFGVRGDFTTAPEVSQVFGESIGLWMIRVFGALITIAKPTSLRIVELGPGRGTLLSDALRTIGQIVPKIRDVLHVDLVEMSPKLQKVQERALESAKQAGVTFKWHTHIDTVEKPDGAAIIFLAQEFFDALAVHQFVKTQKGWCERLVDVDESSNREFPLRYVLSPGPTPAAKLYEHLLPDDVHELELSPEAIAIAETIGSHLRDSNGLGAALVVDYGRVGPFPASVRAIRNHEIEPALAHPGEADLSVDVDFGMLAAAFERGGQGKVRAYGPTSQMDFLHELGSRERFLTLLSGAGEKQAAELVAAYQRLTAKDQMGDIYKVLAVTHVDVPRPFAF